MLKLIHLLILHNVALYRVYMEKISPYLSLSCQKRIKINLLLLYYGFLCRFEALWVSYIIFIMLLFQEGSLNVQYPPNYCNAPFSATRKTMHNISGKKKFILILQVNVHRCIQSNLDITAMKRSPCILRSQDNFQNTINKRFRYSCTFPETYTLGVRDSSCALDVDLTDPHPPTSCTPEIKPLSQQFKSMTALSTG